MFFSLICSLKVNRFFVLKQKREFLLPFLSSFFVFSPCALATADVAFGKVLVKYLFGFKVQGVVYAF